MAFFFSWGLAGTEAVKMEVRSGQDLGPEKPVCVTSCQGYVTDPAFSHAFLLFPSLILQLLHLNLES